MSPLRGRHRRRRRQIISGTAALLTLGGAVGLAVVVPGTADAAGLDAAYSRTSDWGTGYSAQYQVTNSADSPDGFTLEFDLPDGATLTSLWNAAYQVDGRHVTVTPPAWQTTLAPRESVDVGFVIAAPGGATDPLGCRINGEDCTPGSGNGDPGPEPAPSATGPAAPSSPPPNASPTDPATPPDTAPRPTAGPGGPGTGQPGGAPTSTPSMPPVSTAAPPAPPSPSAPPSNGSGGSGGSGGFAPYVDTSLYPPFDLVAAARTAGLRDVTLAFVVAGGGGCTPKWGGVSDLTMDGVPGQIGRFRELGGDVRVSFGGASGTELASACGSAGDLAAAYRKVVDVYGVTRLDFDVEGGALPDAAANTRRAQAIARLQQEAAAGGRPLEVSFTLPVLPSGLTQAGVDLLANARENGVTVNAVNIMAMDYGDGAAPNPAGRMGQYAIDAATATQAQVKGVFELSDAQAWRRVAVTPMIGVNDVASEVFTLADARQLVRFASQVDLAWLSMWSLTRDQPCPGGPVPYAQPTCGGIEAQPFDFTRAFNAAR
ncbi:cellulose binding domain-containing protein [Parafrankia sp. BMG5.11]|uniref:glycoside hydrolase family 18 protein n=1 Tax=Parafrankia sp. BMG5.11 TaxID=222540 RepID=UPI00103B6DFA|nr:cellulose binding domain-containing protein [Parafrankia sp. BMG5.11]TCJ35056.1 sugar hydrolase [Parafrankia sp. BMG5.11]